MRYLITTIVIMLITIVPAPVVIPPVELPFDPNQSPTVMGYYEEWLDKSIDDGRLNVTAYSDTLVADSNLVEINPISVIRDINDPNMYFHLFSWKYKPTKAGLFFGVVTVRDPVDPNLYDQRRIVLLIKSRSPVITGCRRGIEYQ